MDHFLITVLSILLTRFSHQPRLLGIVDAKQ
jgi:hypothetical protein